MSNSKHTPGPWRLIAAGFSQIKDTSHWCCEIYGALERAAIVHHCSPSYGIGAEETQANARLIAASPELLAALKRIANATMDADGSTLRPSRDVVEQAIRAIAKAEGESK